MEESILSYLFEFCQIFFFGGLTLCIISYLVPYIPNIGCSFIPNIGCRRIPNIGGAEKGIPNSGDRKAYLHQYWGDREAYS